MGAPGHNAAHEAIGHLAAGRGAGGGLRPPSDGPRGTAAAFAFGEGFGACLPRGPE